jgi:hypothetical protein
LGTPGGQDLLHVIIGSRPGQGNQHSLEEHHAEEDPEQGISVTEDLFVHFWDDLAPVKVEAPPKKGFIQPSGTTRGLSERAFMAITPITTAEMVMMVYWITSAQTMLSSSLPGWHRTWRKG